MCAVQVGPPGQVRQGEMKGGFRRGSGIPRAQAPKEEVEENGLEQSDEEKIKSICKDTNLQRQTNALFTSGRLSSCHKLYVERLRLNRKNIKNILVRI